MDRKKWTMTAGSAAVVALLFPVLSFGTAMPVSAVNKGGMWSGIAERCVYWSSEARFEGMGFSHYVHLHNRCKDFMRCDVKTSVNKTPIRVQLKPDAKRTVKTFAGSPSSEFKTYVRCAAGRLAKSGD